MKLKKKQNKTVSLHTLSDRSATENAFDFWNCVIKYPHLLHPIGTRFQQITFISLNMTMLTAFLILNSLVRSECSECWHVCHGCQFPMSYLCYSQIHSRSSCSEARSYGKPDLLRINSCSCTNPIYWLRCHIHICSSMLLLGHCPFNHSNHRLKFLVFPMVKWNASNCFPEFQATCSEFQAMLEGNFGVSENCGLFEHF